MLSEEAVLLRTLRELFPRSERRGEVALSIAGAIRSGMTRPGSWEREIVRQMGLVGL